MPWARYLPGAALGLFAARIAGEQIGLPGLWAAVLLSVVLGAVGAGFLARWPLSRTWPALILLIYVVQPEVNPRFWVWTLIIVLAAVALNEMSLAGKAAHGRAWTSRSADWLIIIVLFVAALVIYIATLAPDVLAADSGELQVVAAQLGVAHPPGFPLYVMLAHLATRLPVGSPAFAVNLLSAVFATLTIVVVYAAGRCLTGRYLPGVLGALALGTATTFWSQATTANVRSLTGLFAALILYALIKFRVATEQKNRIRADRWLVTAALFMGLGVTHHVSLAFLALIGLAFVALADPTLLRAPRRWLRPIAAGLFGLLPLLYLPLRAGAAARGAAPELATLPGFLEHVLATGFRGDLFYYLAPADLAQRLLIMGNVMTFQFAPFLLAAMLIGLVMLLWRDRQLALLLGGSFAVYTFVAATYRAPQTVEYMMPAYVPAVLLLASAVAWLPDFLGRWGELGRVGGAFFTALVLLAAISQFPGNISASGARHEAADARAFAAPLLDEAPPDSVILAHWHWATPLWYLQEVEGRRPDVDVRFVYPEGEPYETTWARRTTEAFAGARPVITTWVPTAPLPALPVPEPIGEALLYPQTLRQELPPSFAPLAVPLDQVEIAGYEGPDSNVLVAGQEAVFEVAWRPSADLSPELSLYLHLVGPDGVIYGQDDRLARAADGLTLTQFRVTPRPGTSLDEMSVVVGAGTGASAVVATLPVAASNSPITTRNPVHRAPLVGNAATLTGYDWDHTLADRVRLYLHWRDPSGSYRTQVVDDAAVATLDLPPYGGPWGVPVAAWRFPRGVDGGHYVPLGQGIVWTGETFNGVELAPGESTVLGAEFHSSRPINRDLVVSVRLIGLEPDGVHWDWWDLQDSVPAMGAIPTLKWVTGSFVRSPHRVTASAEASPGQALTGALTLYDAFTNRPLPILDERITTMQPWIHLCQGVVSE